MKMSSKYILKFAGVCVVLGIILIGVGVMMGGSPTIDRRVGNTDLSVRVGLGGLQFGHLQGDEDFDFDLDLDFDGYGDNTAGNTAASEQKLESFTAIDADLVAEDITIEYGSDYEMKITGDASAVTYKVENGVLSIDRRKGFTIGTSFRGASIVITLPSGTEIKKCDIETVSAEVDVKIDADELDINTTSGKITAEGSFASVDTASVSGSITVEGGFTECSADSTSGKVDITSSGAREDYQIELATVSGGLQIDGDKISGRSANLGSAKQAIEAKTVSGNISIEFKK